MFQGSLVALVTPFTPDGAVDFGALSQLVDWHLNAGTRGLVLLGTTGESPTVSTVERKQMISGVLRQVENRIPVIVGTGTHDTRSTIELTAEAKSLGATAALVVTPYYNKPPQRGLVQHYQAVSKLGLPIVLYNVPSRTGVDLLPETVLEIDRSCEAVCAFKEASTDLQRVTYLKESGCRLDLLSGDDATAKTFMQFGGEGVISVTANVMPRLMADLCEAVHEGRFEDADKIDHRLSDLHHRLFIESNPIAVKWMLSRMGKIHNVLRLPLVSLDSQYYPLLEACMNKLGISDKRGGEVCHSCS